MSVGSCGNPVAHLAGEVLLKGVNLKAQRVVGHSSKFFYQSDRHPIERWFYFLLFGLNYLRFSIYDLPITIYYSLVVIRYSQQDCDLTFAVRVIPRASFSGIVGEYDGALRVRIAAPPVAGVANRELIKVLAKSFKVPQNAVEIVSGANSKSKTVRIHGANAAKLEQLILSK